jgi:hypothetical protein
MIPSRISVRGRNAARLKRKTRGRTSEEKEFFELPLSKEDITRILWVIDGMRRTNADTMRNLLLAAIKLYHQLHLRIHPHRHLESLPVRIDINWETEQIVFRWPILLGRRIRMVQMMGCRQAAKRRAGQRGALSRVFSLNYIIQHESGGDVDEVYVVPDSIYCTESLLAMLGKINPSFFSSPRPNYGPRLVQEAVVHANPFSIPSHYRS